MSILESGNEGNAVIDLQTKLQALGYTINEIDGIFGPNTKQAVCAFQSDYGLSDDGLAGPNTMTALNKQYESIEAQEIDEIEEDESEED